MFKKLIKNLFEITVTFIFFPFILISAIRFTSKTKSNPDVVWGPNAINPIKNNSLALRKAGRISDSYVDIIYSINNRDEFNYYYFALLSKIN